MKRTCIIILFFISTGVTAQTDAIKQLPLDSLFSYLENEINDINTSHRFDETYDAAYFALNKALQEGKPEDIAQAHNLIASYHYFSVHSNNPDSTYFHDKKTLDYLLLTDDLEKIARAYDRVGKDLVSLGRFLQAEENLFEVVRIYEELELPMEVGRAYASLNYLFRESQDYEQALFYGEKSLELIEANHTDENELIQPLLGLIHTYPKVEQAELGLEKAQQVVDIITRRYDVEDNVHMANVRAWRGKVYVALEDYEKALEDFFYSWNVIKTIVKTEEEADGWKGDIGNVYRLQGKYGEAIPYIMASLIHHQERGINNWEMLENYQFWLAECYEKTNQPDSALFYTNNARHAQNQRITEELAAVKSELRIKYDSDKKEATISEQMAQIRQQNQIQRLSLGIGGLLILLLGSGFFTYRNNLRKNQQLQILNEDLAVTNHQLDQRNAQNELLLKEIHHRVKNNLEIVSSLLELQLHQTNDLAAQSAMKESQSRVRSMGILHQKLFRGNNLMAIEMKEYFQNLTENLLDAFNASEKVKVDYQMEPIELDVDTALPIGLIVNEVMTNSLKYAFTKNGNGKIQLSLKPYDEHHLHLSIADDGVGKDETGMVKGTGFGTQLVSLLTRQLGGTMQEEIINGTRVSFLLKRAG
ncbi:MAG: histidine kinase dimerization/phosphoacceptor domain -containing protein [Bacteroidales bacterium]